MLTNTGGGGGSGGGKKGGGAGGAGVKPMGLGGAAAGGLGRQVHRVPFRVRVPPAGHLAPQHFGHVQQFGVGPVAQPQAAGCARFEPHRQ